MYNVIHKICTKILYIRKYDSVISINLMVICILIPIYYIDNISLLLFNNHRHVGDIYVIIYIYFYIYVTISK